MRVLTMTDQDTCKALVKLLGIETVLKPIVPNAIGVDGLMELEPGCWVVATLTAHGQYILHTLENATSDEAFAFLKSVRNGEPITNPRKIFIGPDVPTDSN